MKIGLISDSHGAADRLQTAVVELTRRGADRIVHCGDVTTPECIEVLAAAPVGVHISAGNMDASNLAEMRDLSEQHSYLTISDDMVFVRLGDGRKPLAATHGHNERLLDDLIRGEQFAYVCHGHTHRQRDQRIGPTRVINPGALWHPREPRWPSFALLDVDADALEFIALSEMPS